MCQSEATLSATPDTAATLPAPTVRLARTADAGLLAQMYASASGEISGARGGWALIASQGRGDMVLASFESQLKDPSFCVAIASLVPAGAAAIGGAESADGLVVGYATCHAFEVHGGQRLGRVEELYVVPGARRQGVGRALAAFMMDWCTEKDCVGMDANALPGSRPAKSFFESAGFTARLLVMHRRLEDPRLQ